jgi:hypothetical protein
VDDGTRTDDERRRVGDGDARGLEAVFGRAAALRDEQGAAALEPGQGRRSGLGWWAWARRGGLEARRLGGCAAARERGGPTARTAAV